MAPDREKYARTLLGRLLTRAGLTVATPPSAHQWTSLLDLVTSLLSDLEQDRYLLEQALEVSSEEMRALYNELRDAADALRREHEHLRASTATLSATLEATVDGILVVDRSGRIKTANRRFADMWRISPSRLDSDDGTAPLALVCDQSECPDQMSAKVDELCSAPEADCHAAIECTDGRVFECHSLPLWVDGRVDGRVWSFRDVTEECRLKDELQHLAFHDPLTGLVNRALFDDHVRQALHRQERYGGSVGIAVLDVDGFKHVNDTMGHEVGDAVLVAMAERFRAGWRNADTIARLGGDEFAILTDGLGSAEQAGEFGRRILETFANPVLVGSKEIALGVSVGIAVAQRGGMNSQDLMRHADLAMYRAKRDGKNTFRIFEQAMHRAAIRHHALEQALRRATSDGTLGIAYQPVQEVSTGAVAFFEALARWRHPEHGLVGPELFIPMAEETGLIREIGACVLLESCRQARAWRRRFPEAALAVSVNVSGRQLEDPGFVGIVENTLARTRLAPGALILEITESALMFDLPRVRSTLNGLRLRGVRIAIDDFGTGYSSLAGLSDLPADVLKIDKRFTRRLTADRRGKGVVRAILQLAEAHALHVVAEGVESSREYEALAELGCHAVQGFLIGPPMGSTSAGDYLAANISARKRPTTATPGPPDRGYGSHGASAAGAGR